MKVKCPRCGNDTEYSKDNAWRPFCSKRCKESDLYGWLKDDEEETKSDLTSEGMLDPEGYRH